MVEMNVMLRDVGELVRREVELRGDNVGADRVRIGRIAIDRPRPLIVAQGEFPAADTAFGVIERGKNDRCAKLSFIDQICRQLVITVETNGEAWDDDLADPEIEIMRSLRLDRIVLLNQRSRRRV